MENQSGTDPVIATVGDLRNALAGYPNDMPLRFRVDKTLTTMNPHACVLSDNVYVEGLKDNDILSEGPGTHAVLCFNINEDDQNQNYARPGDSWFESDGFEAGNPPRQFLPDYYSVPVTHNNFNIGDVLDTPNFFDDMNYEGTAEGLGMIESDAVEIGRRFDQGCGPLVEQGYDILARIVREYAKEKGFIIPPANKV